MKIILVLLLVGVLSLAVVNSKTIPEQEVPEQMCPKPHLETHPESLRPLKRVARDICGGCNLCYACMDDICLMCGDDDGKIFIPT